MAVESVSEDIGTDKQASATRWHSELDLAEKEFEFWNKDNDKIRDRYLDERKFSPDTWEASGARFNIFWSNIEILKPTIYARTPKPEVERRFKNNDILARLASHVWQNAISYQLKVYDFDGVMQAVRDDFLLYARGVARVRYVPTIGEDGVVTNEIARCDYIHPKDFRHNAARIWDEVRWVGFRSYLTRDELKQTFGDDLGSKIPLTFAPKGRDSEEEKNEFFKKAKVWEIWNKDSRSVIFVAEGFDEVLKEVPDFLHLKDFFPCPKPFYGTLSTSSLIPRQDYILCKDQYQELDTLTQRICTITECIKATGAYDASEQNNLADMFTAADGTLIPVPNWAAYSAKGGLKDAIIYLPVSELATVLGKLYQARDRVLTEIQELTGISDLVRGSSNPETSAKAEQIKGAYANRRLETRQEDMQRFARDIVSMCGEIVAEHFTPESIRLMSGFDYMADAAPDPMERESQWAQVMGLLKIDPLRRFRIDIETDSTLAFDDKREKEARLECVGMISTFLDKFVPLAQQNPSLSSMAAELLKFAVRSFRPGKGLESVIETSFDNFTFELQNPPEPEVDPKILIDQEKLRLEEQKIALNAQIRSEKMQIELQKEMSRQQMEYGIEIQKIQANLTKIQSEIDKFRAANELEAFRIQVDASKPQPLPAPPSPPSPPPVSLNIPVVVPESKPTQVINIPPI